jgi:small subunit ribosomal protein S17
MVEEQQQPENGEQPGAEEPPADESAVESPPSAEEEPAAETPQPAKEETAAAEKPATAEAAPEAEPEEQLTPKQRRKRGRSLHTGEARSPRSPEERNRDRLERRAAKATARRRARAREHRGEPGTGTSPRARVPGSRKVRQGVVVSAKPEKTITVRIEIARRHPVYEKVVRRTNTVHAHDERNEAQEGDVVRVVESRPLSRTKRWRLVEILERAR